MTLFDTKTITVETLNPPSEAMPDAGPIEITCFKAYDIRGRIPDELNEDIAYRIGRAVAKFLNADTVVVGRDIRLSSPSLSGALIKGIKDQGADVLDIGVCGSEEVYFATTDLGADGGVIVTASHNPADYNGMKFVSKGSRPVSGDNGLFEIRAMAQAGGFAAADRCGRVIETANIDSYTNHLLSYVDPAQLRPLKIVTNPGNGGAGKVIDALEARLPFSFTRIQHEADGHFPHGVPNPLLPENRAITAAAVQASGADLGIAWDGDFDRCFLFDETGAFIEGYYIVGLLAEALLANNPGQKIIHDPRLIWNTQQMVADAGGIPVMCKTGHAFIKARMRAEDAIYGGEMSAHHYFRDFAYCDSGMIPWLLVTQLLSQKNKPLSALVDERIKLFPVSGEINRVVANPPGLLKDIESFYSANAVGVDYTDGLSMEFADWRFNIRASNTEPVVRLNVESRGDPQLMQAKRDELLELVDKSA
jgi:phosphomannomutase